MSCCIYRDLIFQDSVLVPDATASVDRNDNSLAHTSERIVSFFFYVHNLGSPIPMYRYMA